MPLLGNSVHRSKELLGLCSLGYLELKSSSPYETATIITTAVSRTTGKVA